MPDPRNRQKRMQYTGATPKRGWAGSSPGEYNNAAEPRVGGKAPQASGLRGASRSQVKRAKRIARKIRTTKNATNPRY